MRAAIARFNQLVDARAPLLLDWLGRRRPFVDAHTRGGSDDAAA